MRRLDRRRFLTIKGRKLPAWKIKNGWAAEFGPSSSGTVTSSEPVEELTRIPYGCSNIRITEFPELKE